MAKSVKAWPFIMSLLDPQGIKAMPKREMHRRARKLAVSFRERSYGPPDDLFTSDEEITLTWKWRSKVMDSFICITVPVRGRPTITSESSALHLPKVAEMLRTLSVLL